MTTEERTELVLLIASSADIPLSLPRAQEVARLVEGNVEALNKAVAPEPLEALPVDFARLLKEVCA